MSEITTENVNKFADEVNAAEGVAEEVELSIEDLYAEEIDNEKIKKEVSELLLPVGTYTTTPPFEFKLTRDKNGRPVGRFFGKITLGDKEGRLGFRMSHVRVNKKDKDGNDTGAPDMAYKLYLQAVKAYKQAYEAEPSNPGQVFTYLRDYPVRVRVTQYNEENMIVSVSAVPKLV